MTEINGFKIYQDHSMTVPGEPFQVERTWKERLLSRPWRPFQKTRTVVPQIPSKEMIRFGDKLIGHPETVAELLRTCQHDSYR